MIPEIIASILLFVSFFGLLFVIAPKLHQLSALPSKSSSFKDLAKQLKTKVEQSQVVKPLFAPELLLQKLLSKLRIYSIKAENKSGKWLEELRKKSQEKRQQFSEDYWKQLKKKRSKEGKALVNSADKDNNTPA